MQFFHRLLVAFSIATTALANPVAKPNGPTIAVTKTVSTYLPDSTIFTPHNPPPEEQEDCDRAGVYICEHVGWGAPCTRYNNCVGGGPDNCYTVSGKASSIGPDEGYTCSFYKNGFCRDFTGDNTGVLKLSFPGESVLTHLAGWNDQILSYQCWHE